MDTLDKYIIQIKNVMPIDLCEEIINEYKNCSDWLPASTDKGEITHFRKCNFLGLSHSHVMRGIEKRIEIDQKLFKVASECIRQYNHIFKHSTITEDTGYDLLQYNEGDYYVEHTDSYLIHPRLVSCSLALNDDFEGGEFAFFSRDLKYKLEKGDALIFPSNFMYPHEILPVTKGTRYSVITWFR